jgi:glycosyltransferase involved in cell wall biosynthesis
MPLDRKGAGLHQRRMRVLYFTVTPLADEGNGGSICCRNHVRRLAEDGDIELFAMVAGSFAAESATMQFFASLGVTAHYQPYYVDRYYPEGKSLRALAAFAWKMLFQFPWETQRLNQQHVSDGVDWAIRAYKIDTIIIDYHPSALFLKLLRSDVRTVLIALNREGDFYADMIALGMSHHGWLSAKISLFRARLFERRKNSEVDKVIVIGQPDAARYPLRSTPVCITPYLDRKPGKWSLQAGKGLFFVGNIAHYPNRMAIDWIAQKFAPHLLRLCPAARISIVGARPDQLSSNVPNVDCLGPADAEAVRGLFLSGNIMLCPVENDYGVKFKAVEALSYGTPLLASRQTHLGLPQLEGHGAINLEDPVAAARMAADLLENPHVLFAFQAAQQILQSRCIESQKNIWSKTIATIPPK